MHEGPGFSAFDQMMGLGLVGLYFLAVGSAVALVVSLVVSLLVKR